MNLKAEDHAVVIAFATKGTIICAWAGIEPNPENVVRALRQDMSATPQTERLLSVVAKEVNNMRLAAQKLMSTASTH